MVRLANCKPIYYTQKGEAYCGDALELLPKMPPNSIDLLVTSPPFALLRKKEYGGKDQDEYVDWLLQFAQPIKRVLKDTGSFVLDLGGAYKEGEPVRSLYNYRVLIRLCDEYGFELAEEFFWYNPAKLPSPIEYVNKRKIRVKDAVNTVWWFSKTSSPKANVENILKPYSKRMKKLLKSGKKYYTPKTRPSGHEISEHFNKRRKGAIPPNLLQIANTASNTRYQRYCRAARIDGHPARFPKKLPEFFIMFLTEEQDTVLDIFAGSNTTGIVAERNNRNWLAFDNNRSYLAASAFRFVKFKTDEEIKAFYKYLLDEVNNNVNLADITWIRETKLH